jgi:hypothetical protein
MQPNAPAPLSIVRHLIACEDIQRGSPERFALVNVITRIRSLDPVPFPLLYGEICFIAICTACRGPARVQLRIVEEESGVPIYTSPVWPAPLPNDPLQVAGLPFRVRNLTFPRAGWCQAQLWYHDVLSAEEPLRLSE